MASLSIKNSITINLEIEARVQRVTIYKDGRTTIQEDDCTIKTDSMPIAATKSSLQIVFNHEYANLRTACSEVGHDKEGSGWVINFFTIYQLLFTKQDQ